MSSRPSSEPSPVPRKPASLKSWLWYAAVWVPVALLYSMSQKVRSGLALLVEPRPMSWGDSLISGFAYVVPVALLTGQRGRADR